MENEEMLSDDERMAMLSQVFAPKKKVEEAKKVGAVSPGFSSSPSPDVGEAVSKDSEGNSPPLESFGTLLEKTLARRQGLDETEHKIADEDRKHAIDESRKDLIGDMVKTFFKC